MTPTEWLNSDRDYKKGCDVYEHHGTNINLKNFFKRPFSEYNFKKLVSELESLSGGPETIIKVETNFVKISKKEKQEIDFNQLPSELKLLHTEKGKLYKEAQYCHSRLDLLTTDHERFEHAKVIVQNFKGIDERWKKLDYWAEHHQLLPEVKREIELKISEIKDVAKLMKMRNNLRSNISKAKGKPHKADKLKIWEAQLQEVYKQLGDGK